MKSLAAALKPFALALLGALFSASTIVFAGAPLLTLRKSYGRTLYWLLGTAIFLGFLASGRIEFWLPFVSILVLFGVFSELESGHVALVPAGVLSVALSVGVALSGFFLSARYMGLSAMGIVREKTETFVSQLLQINPELKIESSALIDQIPSAIVMTALLTLWIGLMLEGRFGVLARTRADSAEAGRRSFLQFSLPDAFIWIAIATLLGAFVETRVPHLQVVSMNVFNILIVLFFFQGLAVVASFFAAFRVGTVWQILVYVILIGQLFLLLSVIGFMDYWFEFRRRISSKRPAQTTGEV